MAVAACSIGSAPESIDDPIEAEQVVQLTSVDQLAANVRTGSGPQLVLLLAPT